MLCLQDCFDEAEILRVLRGLRALPEVMPQPGKLLSFKVDFISHLGVTSYKPGLRNLRNCICPLKSR